MRYSKEYSGNNGALKYERNTPSVSMMTFISAIADKMIADGENHPYRLIRRLAAMERRNSFARADDADEITIIPNHTDPMEAAPDGNPHFSCNCPPTPWGSGGKAVNGW